MKIINQEQQEKLKEKELLFVDILNNRLMRTSFEFMKVGACVGLFSGILFSLYFKNKFLVF